MHYQTNNAQTHQQNNHLKVSPQVLYKQFFECTCSKVFNSLNQYQQHIANQNHQDLYQIPPINQDPQRQQVSDHNNMQQQPTKIPKPYPNNFLNMNQIGQNIPTLNNLNISNQQNSQNSIYYNKKSYQFPNFSLKDPILDSHQQQLLTRQSQLEQKQQSFKYIQAYYANKMAPYYRQFDIDPQKPFSYKKYAYQNRNPFSISSISFRIPQNSSKFTRSDATKDLNKILEELGVRMIPVENGIVEFIYLFTTENSQKISKIKDADVQKMERNLQENINKLTQICYKNKELVTQSDLFMDSDIDFSIKMFVEFLKQILRQNQLWVGYLMLIPIIQGIIKFCEGNKNEIDANLKLIDFPLLLSFMKTDNFFKCQNFLMKVESDKIAQFLVWFTQWYTMVQLVKSKWNIDYIEPSYEQIHYINKLYQDNVNKYRKCVIDKQIQYGKRYKRKIIEKQRQKERVQRQRRRQLKYFSSHRNKFNPIYSNIVDFNIQKDNKTQRKALYDDMCKNNHFRPQFNSHKQDSTFNRLTNEEPDNKFKQNQKKFTESSQINNIFVNQIHERTDQDRRIKRNYKNLTQNQHINSQINSFDQSQNDMEDDQMKEAYIAAFKSQYVSYFSPESQEARKKQQEKWIIKAQKLKEIIQNPQLLKPQIFSQVLSQLQEVNQLAGMIRIDYRFFSCYQQQILRRMSCKNLKPKAIEESTNNFEQKMVVNDEKISRKFQDKSDPFIIQKNYRFRSNNPLCFYKNQFLVKHQIESQSNEVKSRHENNQKLEIYQKMNKFHGQKKDWQNQVKKDQQKEKYLNKEQKVDTIQLRHEKYSNDFLDQLL